MGEFLKKYLTQRKESIGLHRITHIGMVISQVADKYGKSKTFKPSEYELESFKNKCEKSKNVLIEAIDHYSKEGVPIPDKILLTVNELDTNKLSDCLKLGGLFSEYDAHVRSHKKLSVFTEPFSTVEITIGEAAVVFVVCMIVTLAWSFIKGILLKFY